MYIIIYESIFYKHTDICLVQGNVYLGQTMRDAMATNQVIPDPIKISSTDMVVIRAMKQLAIDMTRPQPEDRPTMDEVEMRLTQIQGGLFNIP